MCDPEFVSENVLENYEIIGKIARGCYGLVWLGKAYSTGEKKYAIKRVVNAFRNARDAQRVYREITILLELNGHANIVEIFDVVKCYHDQDIYIVCEFVTANLANLLKNTKLLKIHQVFLTYQLLRGMLYIHTGGIVHRDIKPQNILVNAECRLKLCDFGYARTLYQSDLDEDEDDESNFQYNVNGNDNANETSASEAAQQKMLNRQDSVLTNTGAAKLPEFQADEEGIMSYYVGARWYRSPEQLLGSTVYDFSADMWSVGCVAAEIITGCPIFRGSCSFLQLEIIYQHLGKPDPFDILTLDAPYAEQMFEADLTNKFLPLADLLSGNHSSQNSKDTQQNLANNLGGSVLNTTDDPECIDFIELCLKWSPPKRLTADEAITHPYVMQFHNPDDEPRFREPLTLPLDDDVLFTINDYRDKIYADVLQIQRVMKRLDML